MTLTSPPRTRPAAVPGDLAGRTADTATLARALAGLFAAASLLATAFLLVPDAGRTGDLGMVACIGAGFATAAAFWLLAARIPAVVLEGALVWGTALITAGIFFDSAGSAHGVFYVWVSLIAFYFFPLRRAIAHVALALGLFAVALVAIDGVAAAPQRWLMILGTVAAAGLLIELLKRRLTAVVAELDEAARTDPLTGLFNRRALGERIDLELDRARRTGERMSVVVLDLDRFKALNDRFGHETGDRALRHVGRLLDSYTRGLDAAGRLGGEEFAILLCGADAARARVVADRIRSAIHQAFGPGKVPLTASLGVATCPDDGIDAGALLRAADRALYVAKAQGRNRVVLAADSPLAGAGPVPDAL